MKTTDNFKQVIKSYLWQRAGQDSLFAPNLAKTNKNLDDCITYILNEVQKSGCNGFTDDEIFSMAVHYYITEVAQQWIATSGKYAASAMLFG